MSVDIGDGIGVNMTENDPQLELELYFLIAKFLSNGPCQNAYKILRAEMAKNKLLPKRVDWSGQEHFRTYGNLVSTHGHISSNHLKDLCKQLLTLVEHNSGSCPKGLKSLLGAGQFSVLRTEETCKHTIWKSSSYLVRRNGHPVRPPHNLLHPPNITTILKSRETIGSARMDLILSGQFYGKMNLLFRSLGHLSSVYCVLFDRTGNFIITGSDDNLVKVWSAISGRLLCTFRGHAAEINDMAVNFSNRLLAVGSCDRLIRVWNLKTSAPVAILHGHTHMITSLRFSPYTKGTTNYLASTGGDGCLCVWEYNIKTNVFNPKPIKFVEKSRAGAQMLCLSFSAGGGFVATGSLDNVVRVYSLGGRAPEKICELESHNDRIDSIQYSNSDLRFVSGSKDGYARIWRYERQEWKAIVLSMADNETGNSKNDDSGDWSLPQRKVTMVCWTVDDAFVVTAVSDFTIKVWNSSTGQLCHTLKGHANEVFVLEPNPVDRRILLSAGHDGNIFFWDVITGQKVRTFKNTMEGQGFVSVFDCKWSPDGQSFAATDSLGYLLYFGFGSNDKYKKLPEEIYFHTDYRPLMRDLHNNVLDEQTQVPPHMLPPPFLVDIDGNPHSPKYQRLVPGREDCNDTQLVPLVVVAPNGNREVLDDLTGELRAADEEVQLAGVLEQSANENPEDRPIIDEMIARMQQVQDMQLMREGNGQPEPPTSTNRIATRRSSNVNHNDDNTSGPSSGNISQGPLSPPLTNQSRSQASRSASASQQDPAPPPQAPPSPGQEMQLPVNMCIWKQRDLVKQLDERTIKNFFEGKVIQAEEERANFLAERKKKPIQAIIQRLEDTNDMTSHARTRMMKQKRSRMLSMDRNEERGRNRLERRALYDTDESEQEGSVAMSEEEEEEEDVTQEYSFMENSKNRDSSDDSASTVYSDWSPGRTHHPPTRQSQRRKKNTRASTWNESGSEEDTEVDEDTPEVKKSKVKVNGISKSKNKNSKNVNKRRSTESVADENSNDATEMDGEEGKKESKIRKGKIVLSKKPTTRHGPHVHPRIHGEVRELPQEFRPPEWLTSSIPHKTPYFPQVGDEVIYFFQGHQQYVEAVKSTGAYQIDPARTVLPWVKLPQIREQELMKVIAIKYEIKPPRLVCLKLAFIDPETSRMTGGSVTIKYHDMVGVIDFVVLRHTYNVAMQRNWNPGDNFRCLIDDTWWHGAILSHEPFHPDYPDSMFQCYVVQWDNGEQERLSPWDFEPVDDSRLPEAPGGNVPVTREELLSMRYPVNHKPHDWPHLRCEEECDRIVEGLERIMDLSIAEPFLVPVDLNAFPIYAMVIEYPIDLSLIKERLLNRFYRRLAAVQYDIRHIETNARVFNEPSSQIVKSAKIVTDLCLAFVSDPNCYDPMPIYNLMTQRSAQGRNASRSDNEEDSFNQENSFHAADRRKTRHARISERLRLNGVNNRNNWREQCLKLLDLVIRCPDSLPFQHPVDISEFPDYLQIVHQPMDLSTIRNNLESDLYDNPNEFCRDVRLIFTNSRAYNTNRRSKIYVMTLRLLAMFEEQLKITLKGIKECKKESSGKTAAHLKAFSSFKKSGHSNANSSTRTVGNSSFNGLNGSAFDTSGNSGQHDNSSTALQSAHSSSQQNRSAKRRRIVSDEDDDDNDDDEDEEEEEDEEIEEDCLISPKQRREERSLRSGAKSSKGEKSRCQNDHRPSSNNNNRHQSKRPKFNDDEEDDDDVTLAVKKPKKSGSERKRNSNCIYKDDLEDEIEEEEEEDDGDQTSDVDFRISSYRRKGQRSKGERAREKKRKKNKKNKKDKSKKKSRKSPYYEDDDDEEDEDEDEEEEDEDDVEINYRIRGSSSKRKRAPSRRPDSRNDGYGTRCSTGSIKRRRYDKEYEEDVLNKSINNGMVHHYEDDYEDASKRSLRSRHGQVHQSVLPAQGSAHSHSTGDVLMIRLSRNGVEQALSAGRHQINSHNKTKTDATDENAKNFSASDSEETDEDAKEEDRVKAAPPKNNNNNNIMASSYTSGSTEKNDATDDDEEDDDDTEDESDGSETETYSNRSGPSNNRPRTSAERPDHRADRPAKVRNRKGNSPKVGYRTRNQGRRTIQYTEQDDEEDDGTGDKNAVGVSSRGRPQRPNVRLASMVRH